MSPIYQYARFISTALKIPYLVIDGYKCVHYNMPGPSVSRELAANVFLCRTSYVGIRYVGYSDVTMTVYLSFP